MAMSCSFYDERKSGWSREMPQHVINVGRFSEYSP